MAELTVGRVEVRTRLAEFITDWPGMQPYRYDQSLAKYRHESSFTEDERESWGDGRDGDDLVADVLSEALRDNGMEGWIYGPCCTLTVDMSECRYSKQQVARMLDTLVLMIEEGEPFPVSREPYTYNQSGNPNYWDPKRVPGVPAIPEKVLQILKRRA